MANDIRNFRAGLAQNDRNKGAYILLLWEILIFAFCTSLWLGWFFDSDTVWGYSFLTILLSTIIIVNIPIVQIIVFILFAFMWATPFVVIAIYVSWFFYVIALIAFCLSFAIHFFAITYLNDLTRIDK